MPRLNTTTFDKNFKELLREEAEIEGQLSELQGRLTEIKGRISSYRLVSEECAEASAEIGMVEMDELRTLSLKEALVVLAGRNNGELNVYQARPLLIDAGLLRGDSRSMSSRLHEALTSSKQLEQTGERGRWRLVSESEPVLPGPLPRPEQPFIPIDQRTH